MANANPNEPTGGAMDFDPHMLTPDADAAKFDKALEEAFGPQATNTGNINSERGDGAGSADDASITGDGTTPPDPSIDPNAGASAEGEGEGGEDGNDPTGAIGGDTADFSALFRSRYNRDPEPGELEGYIQLAEWAAQLTPEQQVAINNALADPGRYVNPQYQDQYSPPQTQQQDTQVPSVDPEYAALVEEFGEDHPLVKKIKALEGAQQVQANESLQIQQQRMIQQIDVGVRSFHARYEDLTPQELEQLQGAVARSRIFPGFVQANGGDVMQGMNAALDYVYWQTPEYRQREIEKQYATLDQRKKDENTRKAKAAAVSGSGGNGASRTQAPPKTNDDRWAAVAAGIGQAMNNGEN